LVQRLAGGETPLSVVPNKRPTGRFGSDVEIPSVLAAVRERAVGSPLAPAIEADSARLTYGELHQRAAEVAGALVARGVGPESIVGIYADRHAAFGVAALGVLAAGGAFVPLAPEYPEAHWRTVLADARLSAAIVPASGGTRLDLIDAPLVPIHSDGRLLEKRSPEVWISDASPAQLAYVFYTSGSTGRPKGAMVECHALATFAAAAVAAFDLSASDRWLQLAPLAFDVVIEELFPVWLAGGTVVFVEEGIPPPHGLSALVDERKITVMELSTAYWQEWVEVVIRDGGHLPRTLRKVVVGGERMSLEHFDHWRSLPVPLVHVYGLTETAVTSTTYAHEPSAPLPPCSQVPVGQPMENSCVYILDSKLRLVPQGVVGEVFIGGACVGRGYLGRPSLTAERFLPDSVSAVTGARLYRTGDRGRILPSGDLELLGRYDDQLKIRGFRVEPGEVEAALELHPGVGAAVVTAFGEGAERYLAAHVVSRTPTDRDELTRSVRAHARARLPEHMVPTAVVVLDELPRRPNGKVDRRRIPEPAPRHRGVSASEPPRTDVEQSVAAIVIETIGLEEIGVNDNFFDLGGHSLLAMRVISRVRQAFRVDLPLRAFFETPTVAGLADAVEEQVERVVAGLSDADVARLLDADGTLATDLLEGVDA
jgi:amino acid adenylation domain-containing protein